MLQFIPNAPSTFLWAMNDAHSQMIHSFESILFKGLIKPFGKPVNRFANQYELFVQFPAARAESSEAVTESLRTSRALSAAVRDLFQEECLCLDTINMDIFTIFMLAEYLCVPATIPLCATVGTCAVGCHMTVFRVIWSFWNHSNRLYWFITNVGNSFAV